MQDSPTQNHATLNPIYPYPSVVTLSDANLKYFDSNTAYATPVLASMVAAGKCYWEYTINGYNASAPYLGIGDATVDPLLSANGWMTGNAFFVAPNGMVWNWSPAVPNDWVTYVTGDVIGFAYDSSNKQITVTKNGGDSKTWTANAPGAVIPVCALSSSKDLTVNYGQQPLLYKPAGFEALQTQNLPAATIKDGREHFAVVTYTGTGSTQSIDSLKFQPDFVWIKDRGQDKSNVLFDVIRGPLQRIMSNSTQEEVTAAGTLVSFDPNGFTVGNNTGVNDANGSNYVAWCWNAGGPAVANNDGSTNSQVAANTAAGFSIISYTGTGSNTTIGHGLDKAPEFILCKNRDRTINWTGYHIATDPTNPQNYYLSLNTNEQANNDSNMWVAKPTDSVISVGSYNFNNASGEDLIMYAWHSVPNFSSIGGYVGNANDDGVFVNLNFRPAWLMIKQISASGNPWIIFDSTRDTHNPMTSVLYPNTTSGEYSGADNEIDFVSNGFKIRNPNNTTNQAGMAYVYAAFGENPFGGSNVSPANAR